MRITAGAHTGGGLDFRVDKGAKSMTMLTLHTYDSGTTIAASQVPFVVENITAAEQLAVIWLQQVSDKLKSYENDTHFDQLYGSLNGAVNLFNKLPSGIPAISIGGSDMDNQILAASGNYASEYFELIVAIDSAGNIFTTHFTIAHQATSVQDAGYGFRLVYQTTQGQASPNNNGAGGFSNVGVGGISSASPRCTNRGASFTPSTASSSAAFPILFMPVTVQLNY